ncbi:MAG TPA: hypothetical protein VIH72_08090 [Candidatus Acidoferrales bacterium]|jgi:hypothetical protein
MIHLKTIVLMAGCTLLIVLPVRAQSRTATCDASLGLAKMQHTPPKGRLQDAGAQQTKHIIELGKKAIPMLIACLADQTRTKEPIEDFWPVTTVGDIAFFYLCDLFTDSSWQHSTIDGVVDWKNVSAEDPNSPSWTAWYNFVKRHGRRYVQNAWYKRWKEEESAIFWDGKEQCFKIAPQVAPNNPHP